MVKLSTHHRFGPCNLFTVAFIVFCYYVLANILPIPFAVLRMPFLLAFPPNASPRLKGLQICQLGVVSLTTVYTFLAAVIPSKHKAFTFSLLYGLILTSITTSILINREQKVGARGLLTKDKYAKYQLWKIAAGFVMYFIAFIGFAITPGGTDKLGRNENGLIMNGVKINTFQSIILWTSTFNW
jgi:hypothetical protein